MRNPNLISVLSGRPGLVHYPTFSVLGGSSRFRCTTLNLIAYLESTQLFGSYGSPWVEIDIAAPSYAVRPSDQKYQLATKFHPCTPSDMVSGHFSAPRRVYLLFGHAVGIVIGSEVVIPTDIRRAGLKTRFNVKFQPDTYAHCPRRIWKHFRATRKVFLFCSKLGVLICIPTAIAELTAKLDILVIFV